MVTSSELKLYKESEYDKIIRIANEKMDLALNEYAYVESMIDYKLRLNLQRANLKVIQESGSMDDIVLLTNAAINEAEEQKEANSKTLSQRIGDFFTSIWNAIQQIFTGKNTKAFDEMAKRGQKVKFPCNIADAEKFIDATDAALKTAENTKGLKAAGAAIAAITVGGVGVGIGQFLKNKNGANEASELEPAKAQTIANKAVALFGKLKNIFTKKEKEEDNGKEGDQGIFESIGRFLNDKIITPVKNAVSSFIPKGDTGTDTSGQDKPDGKDGTGEQKDQTGETPTNDQNNNQTNTPTNNNGQNNTQNNNQTNTPTNNNGQNNTQNNNQTPEEKAKANQAQSKEALQKTVEQKRTELSNLQNDNVDGKNSAKIRDLQNEISNLNDQIRRFKESAEEAVRESFRTTGKIDMGAFDTFLEYADPEDPRDIAFINAIQDIMGK